MSQWDRVAENSESAPEFNSVWTARSMSSGCRTGEVHCRNTMMSGRYPSVRSKCSRTWSSADSDVAVDEASTAGRSIPSAPASRLTDAISASSVDTMVLVTRRDRRACSIVCATRGRPATSRTFFFGNRCDPPRAGMIARTSMASARPSELGHDRTLTFIDPFDPIAQGRLHRADIPHQPLEPLRLDGRCVVAAPQRPVQGDVSFDDTSAQGRRRYAGLKPDLLPRIADGMIRTFARSRELFRRVDHFDGPLLEFHRVRSAVLRRIDQALGELEVAIVVDPDLGDHEAGLTFSH